MKNANKRLPANIFKETYRDKVTDEIKECRKYSVRFKAINGLLHSLAIDTDLHVTMDIKQNINRLRSLRLNNEPPSTDLVEWLENVPDKWHKLFVVCGLLDPRHASAVKKIVDHLEDYREYLSRKGTLERHWKQEYSRSKKVVKALKASYWNRITPTGILSVLAELKQKHGWKSRTYNSYLVSFKSFLNWAVRDGRLRENMAQHIPSLNEKVDQTAVQRRLSHEELQRLINATINGEKQHGLTGKERALLYLIAMETGLRWAELYRLTAGDFIMVTDIPYIKAGKTKNGKERCKPLRSYLADMVKGHLATLSGSKDEQFLPGMWKERAYKMIKMDMEAAGIPYKVDGVKFSFHGLRHTYISLGGDNSKSISTVQAMADHASARTTARYLHPEFKEELDTLAKFPNYLAAAEEADTLNTANSDKNSVFDSPSNSLKTPSLWATSGCFTLQSSKISESMVCGDFSTKNPASQGLTGCNIWGEEADSNRRPSEPQSALLKT